MTNCCDMFSRTVAKRPIVVAVCTMLLAILLSMVGMSKFNISTEVKTGRDEYSPEDSQYTQRNDAVTLGRKELKRPLPVQDQQSMTGEKFRTNFIISYRTSDHVSNLFTYERLQIMKKMEDEILALPSYGDFCHRVANSTSCAPLQSPVSLFLDNNGDLVTDIDARLSFLANNSDSQVLAAYFSKDFNQNNLISDVSRTFMRFGYPLVGYENENDRIMEQREKAAKFVVECVKHIEKYTEEYESDMEIFYFGGQAAMDHLVDQILKHDGMFAFLSMCFVVTYIAIHSGSIFLACTGMLHIIMSFPLGYFLLRIIFGIKFFDTMNTFLIYVILGIGADDVIIFLDCWKQIAVESDTRKEGEYTMEERVKHTMMRAGKAMLVTSSTTCGAFLATATSGLMPIAQFGIFAAMMIISNYIMVVTYFPACVVIWDIYLKHVPCCCCFRSAKTSSTSDEISKSPKKPKSRYSIKHKSFDLDDYTKTEAFIYTYFTPFVMRYRLVFLVIMGLWSIFMSYQLSTLELAKTSPVPLPSDHPFYKAVTAVETRYASSTSDPSMHLLIVFGLSENIDRSGYSKFDSMSCDGPCGKVSFLEDFDPSSELAQDYLRSLCNATHNAPYILTGSQPNACFMEDLAFFRASRAESFPIPQNEFNLAAETFLNTTGKVLYVDGEYVGYSGSTSNNDFKIKYIFQSHRVAFRSNKFYSLGELSSVKTYWYDFEASQNTIAPVGVNKMFVTHEPRHALFRNIDLQENFRDGAILGGFLSMLFATLVVLFATRNWWLTAITMMGVGMVVLTTVGMMPTYGWTLGVIESICLTLCVGFSVDFTVHFGLSYLECDGHGRYGLPEDCTRSTRTKHMLFEMGISVCGGAITTLGASAFLMLCDLSFFSYFGIFIFTTVMSSMLVAFFVFPSMTSLIGPADKQGEIPCGCGGENSSINKKVVPSSNEST